MYCYQKKAPELFGVYDVTDGDVCLGIMTKAEIIKLFGKTRSHINHTLKNKSLIQGKYRLEKIDGDVE